MKRYKILTPFGGCLIECEQCEDHENTVILDNQNKTRAGKSWLKELNLRLEPIEEPKKIKAYAYLQPSGIIMWTCRDDYIQAKRIPELDIESK